MRQENLHTEDTRGFAAGEAFRRLRMVIVLDSLRSAHNTGNIFRIADAVGAEKIFCCNYTPSPPHPKLEKTAMGAEKTVPFQRFPDSLAAVRSLKNSGYCCVAAEVGENSVPVWDFPFRFPLALVLGNEALGVKEETMRECDGLVALPMFGGKTSINVGNCAAAILYAIIGKYARTEEKG